MPSPSLSEAFLYWLKLGFISFGGPAGQIAIMHQDLVHDKKWISEARFLHALNFCILLPGPEAQQLAIYMGWRLHKTLGGLIAGILFVLPAFLMLCGLAYIYMAYGQMHQVQGFFAGVKPAIVAIVIFAAYRMGIKTLNNKWLISISALALVGVLFFQLPFPLILLCAAGMGLAGGFLAPKDFKSSTLNLAASTTEPETIHLPSSWKRALKTTSIGLFIISACLGSLVYLFGLNHLLVNTAWFYTKAAFLTFGGAYAVLPYVFQGAVEQYAWLNAQQILDALALGESTPGPLIMVITFMGFVTGWSHAVIANSSPLPMGLLVATIATFFTFAPSFLMIFLGAPIIERTNHEGFMNATLKGITAAVIGMILNLSLSLAHHTFYNLENAKIDWMSVIIAVTALIALTKYKLNTMWVILASGLLGVITHTGLLAN
jgi:chromate transporter